MARRLPAPWPVPWLPRCAPSSPCAWPAQRSLAGPLACSASANTSSTPASHSAPRLKMASSSFGTRPRKRTVEIAACRVCGGMPSQARAAAAAAFRGCTGLPHRRGAEHGAAAAVGCMRRPQRPPVPGGAPVPPSMSCTRGCVSKRSRLAVLANLKSTAWVKGWQTAPASRKSERGPAEPQMGPPPTTYCRLHACNRRREAGSIGVRNTTVSRGHLVRSPTADNGRPLARSCECSGSPSGSYRTSRCHPPPPRPPPAHTQQTV